MIHSKTIKSSRYSLEVIKKMSEQKLEHRKSVIEKIKTSKKK